MERVKKLNYMVKIQPHCNFADKFVLYVHFMQTLFYRNASSFT